MSMQSSRVIPELCPVCRRKKEEQELIKVSQVKESADPLKARREALTKAEQCRFFEHHTIYYKDENGEWARDPKTGELKIDPQMGLRTCSFIVGAGCGHLVHVYGLCDDWFDGKLCPNWCPS